MSSQRSRGIKKAVVLVLLFPVLVEAKKFYDDDPIEKEPPPLNTEHVTPRQLNDHFDILLNTFTTPGERQPKKQNAGQRVVHILAQAVNTLGEVPDSVWFTNRIGSRPLSIEELLRGPGNYPPPSIVGLWTITGVEPKGTAPGFTIQDSKGGTYVLRFDPLSNPEMTTGAAVIGSAFFHALGYNVPENYIVAFAADKLVIGEGVTHTDPKGREIPITLDDVNGLLKKVPRDDRGRLRGIATQLLTGESLGPFRFHGTRSDDPNDIVPHEHRRDLRGLFVFCAWLGHHDTKPLNTEDVLVQENGSKFVKHYLVDFGSILGSAASYPKSGREGNEYLYEFKPAAIRALTLGLYVPRWARTKYRRFPSLGRFDHGSFKPETWKPQYPNPAFQNRLPDDAFWAAKKVMSFRDDQIRAIVTLGQYSDPEAESWLTKCLIERRNKVGETYFARVLPLDGFRVNGERLEFEDLEISHGFVESRDYKVQWSRFDNDSEQHILITGAASFTLPEQIRGAEQGSYFAALIRAEEATKTVTVYIRKQSSGYKVVGIDRTW